MTWKFISNQVKYQGPGSSFAKNKNILWNYGSYLENVGETGDCVVLIGLQSDACNSWITQDDWSCLKHHFKTGRI